MVAFDEKLVASLQQRNMAHASEMPRPVDDPGSVRSIYRYEIAEVGPDITEVSMTLILSLIAVSSLHGMAQCRLDVRYFIDDRTYDLDASTPCGRDLCILFTGFLAKEFGDDSFKVSRPA